MRNLNTLKKAVEAQSSRQAGEVSIIELVDLLVEYGYSARASDIHVQPVQGEIIIRFRIDGILRDAFKFSEELHSEIISRIKVLSDLKTDVHQVPQDGRFRATIGDVGAVDIRVSIAPTYYGENAIMRILAQTSQEFSLEELGMDEEQIMKVRRAIQKPYGMVLSNGPTGSGKTTTLYTLLKKLNTRESSIITIEDPIEYSIQGITQMPVNVDAGLSFANGLRSILRQDPNIIMVGEIRDEETAGIAINAALTGHLMFSTLHTNDAATTFPRLLDMGVPPFLVASTLNVAVAQRLVRKVCPTCRKQRALNVAEMESVSGIVDKLPGDTVYVAGEGCDACEGLGYSGRIGIFEVLEVDDNIRPLIITQADSAQIKKRAVEKGMVTMVEDGLKKAQKGVTTIEEVLRIIYD